MTSRNPFDLDPRLQSRVLALLNDWKDAGINAVLTATYRPIEDQAAAYALGRDAAGNIVDRAKVVTFARPGYSWHQHRLALDFLLLVNGKLVRQYTPAVYGPAVALAKQHGLVWGGDFPPGKHDYDHLEWHPGLAIGAAAHLAAQGVSPLPLTSA